MRPVNAAGIALLKKSESCRLLAYEDEKSLELPKDLKYWTIGWGHTGQEVHEGMRITQELADRIFEMDVVKHASGVERALKVDVSPNQYAALVSLAFNIGVGAFARSDLLKLLNQGDYLGASNRFLDFKYSNHKLSTNLLERRQIERELFLAGTEPRVA